VGLSALAISILVPVAAMGGASGLHVAAASLVAVVVMSWLLGCALGSVGLLVSALTGQRSLAAGIAGAAAVLAYLCSSFLPLIAGLQWVRHLSPYYWFTAGDPLANGIQIPECLLLLGFTALSTAGAAVALNLRDLRA
jgi:ABC-2 type transport system permease protein